MERDGSLFVKERQQGPTYYAKWRDGSRRQVMKALGPAWVERHGGGWRKRRGACPDGYLVPNEAVARMHQAIEEHEARRLAPPPQAVTFEEAAWAWHANGRLVGGWKPATARDRASLLRVHLLPAFGTKRLEDLTKQDVRRWWREIHDPRRPSTGPRDRGGSLSDRNANRLLSALRTMLRWAAEEYGVPGDAADGIKKHREPVGDKANFFTPEEVMALVRAAEEHHRAAAADPDRRERAYASRWDATIFLVAAFSGLRRGEIVSLRWRHIDFARRSIYVVDNVSAGFDARVKDHEARTVPLTTSVAEALARIQPADASPGDLVFPGTIPGRKLDGDALSSRFRATRDRAGLPKLTFHELRHTFGSLAVDGGASLVQVQEWLGHADIKTTRRYLHAKARTSDADLLDAAFAVGAVAQVRSPSASRI